MVVWIEIIELTSAGYEKASPPAWWCGLKFDIVTRDRLVDGVTTCVVVWIEIIIYRTSSTRERSPPAWWCGLK